MLFNSFAYLVFLPVVVALYWLCPFKYRVPLLLVASYVFYMFWKPIYGVLMIALTVVNYGFGLWLGKLQSDKQLNARKACLASGVIVNVLVLSFFKYAYFLRDLANYLMQVISLKPLPPFSFEIILPLGISFFVFEFIHYLVDVYRGGPVVRSLMDFALFPSFFPTQIAGPIKRYQDFIPQLKSARTLNMQEFNEAIELIIFGLFKKVALADNLAVVVNRCYAHHDLLNCADLWLAAYAFVFQIYFDFSGYTDIARGSALLMGFKVPLNFKLPLLSPSMTEFWHRWHISLSTWLRDYVYIPLGGSKGGKLFTYRNLFITMVVGGLWHGASMHFVAWGALMGAALLFNRLWRALCEQVSFLNELTATKAFHYFAIFLTFQVWTVTLIFFRAETYEIACRVLQKTLFLSLPVQATASEFIPTILGTTGCVTFSLLPAILLVMAICQLLVSRFKGTPGIMPIPENRILFRSAYLAALILILLVVAPDSTPQFVYFQF
jgi:alginate O-acetyltransferase complex protein AlgI